MINTATQIKPPFRVMFVLRNSIWNTDCCIFTWPPPKHGGTDRKFSSGKYSAFIKIKTLCYYNVPQKNALCI